MSQHDPDMTAEIRIATAADAAAFQHLNRCFNAVVTPMAWIERALARDDNPETVLLAFVDGQAVGFGCLRVARSACYATPVGEITEVFVLPKWRRQGIGKQLIARLVGVAHASGARDLVVIANAQNAAAQALYAACNFVERGDVILRLTTPNPVTRTRARRPRPTP